MTRSGPFDLPRWRSTTAYFVPIPALTEEGSVDEDELKGHVKQNLARYKVPREVEFLDSLPRNATGKVLKRELA